MANQVFNRALGRITQFAEDILAGGNDAFLVVVVNAGTTTDAAFKDFDTLTDCLPGAGGSAEVTNTNYARKTIDETADGLAITYDDTNNQVFVDFNDQTWTAVAAGTAWTDIIIAYDGDTTVGTDANVIPCTLHDFTVTPDGSDITAQIATNGFILIS